MCSNSTVIRLFSPFKKNINTIDQELPNLDITKFKYAFRSISAVLTVNLDRQCRSPPRKYAVRLAAFLHQRIQRYEVDTSPSIWEHRE